MSTHNNVSWEMVLTAGFELDVLRGKLPYRPTIWVGVYAVPVGYHHQRQLTSKQLYLGTRYSALLTFIVFLIRADGSIKVPCQVRHAHPRVSGYFNLHLIAVRHHRRCESAAYFVVECDADLRRHAFMLVGHSPPFLLLSVCK
jgi:hypothetical protein